MSKLEFRTVPMPDPQSRQRAISRVAEAAHRMNEAVQRAVESGVSIELQRVSRFHDGSGNWGDQMVPLARSEEIVAAG